MPLDFALVKAVVDKTAAKNIDAAIDTVETLWNEYASRNGHTPAEGVGDLNAALASAVAASAAFDTAQAKDRDKFLKAVDSVFGATGRDLFATVMKWAKSIGGDDEHYSKAWADQAAALNAQRVAEGWPTFPTASVRYGAESSPYGYAKRTEAYLDAARSLSSARAAALRQLQLDFVSRIGDSRVRFLADFGWEPMVIDFLSYDSSALVSVPVGWGYPADPYSVAYATIAACARGADPREVQRATLDRVLSTVIGPIADFDRGSHSILADAPSPDARTTDVRSEMNARAETARIAIEEAEKRRPLNWMAINAHILAVSAANERAAKLPGSLKHRAIPPLSTPARRAVAATASLVTAGALIAGVKHADTLHRLYRRITGR